jgi:hypothetical protein
MKKPRRRSVLQDNLDAILADACRMIIGGVVAELTPLLTGRAEAERGAMVGQSIEELFARRPAECKPKRFAVAHMTAVDPPTDARSSINRGGA